MGNDSEGLLQKDESQWWPLRKLLQGLSVRLFRTGTRWLWWVANRLVGRQEVKDAFALLAFS